MTAITSHFPADRTLSPRVAFGLLTSMLLMLLASSSAPTPLYATYQAEWGFSAITITVIFGVYAIAVLLALLVFGSLSDHIGRRPAGPTVAELATDTGMPTSTAYRLLAELEQHDLVTRGPDSTVALGTRLVALGRTAEARADDALSRVDGQKSHLIRPPYGRITVRQLIRCVFAGKRIALWSRDSLDYRVGADQIVRDFRERPPSSGDVLLFHDDGPAACTALTQLLPEWKSAGFVLEAIPHS